MALSRQEMKSLLRLIDVTHEYEINCEECLAKVNEFAECHVQGKVVSEGLQTVEQHLALCGECREEYQLLLETLTELDDTSNHS